MKNLKKVKDISFDFEVNFSESDQIALKKLSSLAQELTGVQLIERHQSMIASRLIKRLSQLELDSLSDYVDYFYANRKNESPKLVSLLTTHHTYFFREFSHFEFIQNKVLPTLIPTIKARSEKKLRIWVAACSRGQEVYSLAMFLDFHLKRLESNLQYEIYATDVDSESVTIAKNGVYLRKELKEVPLNFIGDHWAKGTGEIEAYVKAKTSLRNHCKFQIGNLLELKPGSQPNEKFDIIFCRNVFIYFSFDQIKSISQELLARLSSEGYLFIGISESLSTLKLPIISPGPSVYRHNAQHDATLNGKAIELRKQLIPSSQSKPGSVVTKNLRVLCVDDSPSILTLMKQILSKENGFEVIGTAKNGIEAYKQVQALKPDILTLDIHMPEQTGIEYLEKNFKFGHPPVVMVTSVSRENADLAGKALSLGAADYVEKPALTNLLERGEEIRNKLRCAILSFSQPSRLNLDQSFQVKKSITNPDSKLRVITLPLSSRTKLKAFFKDLKGSQPHSILFIEGAKDALTAFAEVLSSETGRIINYSKNIPSELKSNEITILDFSSSVQKLWEKYGKGRKISVIVFGDVSQRVSEKLLLFQNSQLLLEDLGSGMGAKALMEIASDVVPTTSFAYLSTEFLVQDQITNESLQLFEKQSKDRKAV